MITPSPGRIVEYFLNDYDVEQINRRRDDAARSGFAGETTGAVVHVGNRVHPGDSYPMVIVRVWENTFPTPVNGQLLLDGNDTLWVTSKAQAADDREDLRGTWRAYPRVGA